MLTFAVGYDADKKEFEVHVSNDHFYPVAFIDGLKEIHQVKNIQYALIDTFISSWLEDKISNVEESP